MDIDATMQVATESAKALTKFQDILLKAFGPIFTKKQAKADAYADEVKLNTIRDNPDMEIAYTPEGMYARARTTTVLEARTQQRILAESIRQEENLEAVFELTAKELSCLKDVSEIPVDEDWITRIFSIVKDISNEEMQLVWSKILAGEIQNPGSFSMRTLETVRNISTDEALIFQKILPFVVISNDATFVVSENGILEQNSIPYSDILRLVECGLITSSTSAAYILELYPQSKIAIYNDAYALIVECTADVFTNVAFGVYSLTKAGCELYRILNHPLDEQYFFDFAEIISNKNRKNLRITVHKVIRLVADTFNYSSEILKEYSPTDD